MNEIQCSGPVSRHGVRRFGNSLLLEAQFALPLPELRVSTGQRPLYATGPCLPAWVRFWVFIVCVSAALAFAEATGGAERSAITWKECLHQQAEWYGTAEAVRIADNVLLYQHDTGGWPKNIDMAAPLSETERAAVTEQKRKKEDSTIDNGATYRQLEFLAKVYNATKHARLKEAFLGGLDF